MGNICAQLADEDAPHQGNELRGSYKIEKEVYFNENFSVKICKHKS